MTGQKRLRGRLNDRSWERNCNFTKNDFVNSLHTSVKISVINGTVILKYLIFNTANYSIFNISQVIYSQQLKLARSITVRFFFCVAVQASATIQFHKKEGRWRPSVDLQIFCYHFLTYISPYNFVTEALYCWKKQKRCYRI